MILFCLIKFNDGLLFFCDFFFEFADLIDDLIEFFLGFEQFRTDLAWAYFRV